jgi:y4mF family transcriptional regulator
MLIKTPADIGRIIRGARIGEGLSQSQLATKFGTTQSWISEIENGKSTAELGMVLKVLSFLRIEMDLVPPGLIPLSKPTANWPDDAPDIDGIADGGGGPEP